MTDEQVIDEICECGGIARFDHWDEGNKKIPIVKCMDCGDTFEAHEDSWRD